MIPDETLTTISHTYSLEEAMREDTDPTTIDALCILWSHDEPQRIGEVGLLLEPGHAYILGRGPALVAEDCDRLTFYRQRPDRNDPTEVLGSPALSRQQLRLDPLPGGGLKVSHLGRSSLVIDGVVCKEAVVRPGQLIRVGQLILFQYLKRPWRMPKLRHYPLDRICGFGLPDAGGMVGESPAIWRLRDQLAFIARSDKHVLITGESGTGKELAAQTIHLLSARCRQEMVARNASTFPDTLLDAELFGNVKDYPQSGSRERPGMVGEADKSTLFLDELGLLPQDAQGHLLRVLDNQGQYHRLGEAEARRSDLRFIGATNRDPKLIKSDLRARLSHEVTTLRLQERCEDIPLLIRHLMRELGADDPHIVEQFFHRGDFALGEPRIDPTLVEQLVRRKYEWHVRELKKLLIAAIERSTGSWVVPPSREPGATTIPTPAPAPTPPPRRATSTYTKEEIGAALDRNDWNQEKTRIDLGLHDRFALRRLMAKFGIERRA